MFVVDKEPDFAEAHNMLALARLQGGGVHSAADAIKVAIPLSPRSETIFSIWRTISERSGTMPHHCSSVSKTVQTRKLLRQRGKSGRPAYAEEVWHIAEQKASQTGLAVSSVLSTMKTRLRQVKRLQRSLCRIGANRNSSEAG